MGNRMARSKKQSASFSQSGRVVFDLVPELLLNEVPLVQEHSVRVPVHPQICDDIQEVVLDPLCKRHGFDVRGGDEGLHTVVDYVGGAQGNMRHGAHPAELDDRAVEKVGEDGVPRLHIHDRVYLWPLFDEAHHLV